MFPPHISTFGIFCTICTLTLSAHRRPILYLQPEMSSFPEHTSRSEASRRISLRLQATGPIRSERTSVNRISASPQDYVRSRLIENSNVWHWDGESPTGLPDGSILGGDVAEFSDPDSADFLSISRQGQLQHPLGQSSTNPLHPPNRTPGQYSYSLTSWNAPAATSRRPSQVSAHSIPPMNSGASAADLRLRCNGSGFFRVHRAVLASASSNHFNHLLNSVSPSMDCTLTIDDDFDVMYVILDAIYAAFPMYTFTSEGGRKQDLELPLLTRAIERMIVYGVQPGDFIHSSSLLYKCLYKHTPFQPLDIFTLAAHNKMEALAVQTSSHLLSLNLDTVTAQCRHQIGPQYYNRLLSLHEDRLQSLKLIVTDPPLGHPLTLLCTDSDQDDMVNLWNSGMSMVQRDATPYLSPQFLVAQMRPYQTKINCVSCSQHFAARLSDVAEEWSKVKCSI
ncbi:hypothetical protein BDZ89DRAFT_331956 [Hymenopellis radicata]|nr:hypothetical protein BDZ89DRAFT_331956 [Hymenopellis radicata]